MGRSNLPKTNELDMLSNLPQCLLHKIFSFLEMKEVVQTSLLSRRWRHFWKHLPVLNFNNNGKFSYGDKYWGFEDFVDQVFNLCDSSLNIESVCVNHHQPRDADDNKWIFTALRGNLQELYLSCSFPEKYQLPHLLFTCKSLMILELRSSDCSLKFNLPDSMSLPTLKTLLLEGICFEADNTLGKIFSCCPVLESLTMECCNFKQTNMEISAFQLKHLVVIENCFHYYGDNIIKLCAPNLISFRCIDHLSTYYSIENLSALVKAEIEVVINFVDETEVPEIDNIREVHAENMMRFLRGLNNVEALTLSTWLLEVISGAPSLLDESLLLANNKDKECDYEVLYGKQQMYQYGEEVRFNSAILEVHPEAGVPLQCLLNNLKVVEIREVRGSLNEMKFLAILLNNAMMLEKVALYTFDTQTSRTKKRLIKFTEQLQCLPRASSSIAILLL